MKIQILWLSLAATCLWAVSSCRSFGNTPEDKHLTKIQQSPIYNLEDEQFVNPRRAEMQRFDDSVGFWNKLSALWNRHEFTNPSEQLPEIAPDIAAFTLPSPNIKFIWLGHSSFLVNIQQKILLFDPVFSDKASPFFFGPSRFQTPVIALDSLPKINWIIISHDHYDHLDMETIEFFRDNQPHVQYATPLGVSSHLWEWDIPKEKTHELDWWDSLKLDDSIELNCTPSQHFSGRVIPRSNETLWSSWVVNANGQKLFYSGDTGYSDHFKEINKKYGPFEVAFMENGQYNERWQIIHLLPHRTVQAFEDIDAKHMVSVHWGMFSLSPHAWYEPIEETYKLTSKKQLSHLTPKIGELVEVTDSVHFSPWWKEVMNKELQELKED